jgi:WD40 repeat protein
MSPDGDWVLMISTSADRSLEGFKSFSTYGMAGDQGSEGYINLVRKREEDDFDVIAFDVQGEFFAAADEAGKVAVFPFRPPKYPRQAQAILEKPGPLGPRPLALAFDPRRRWLAGVRGDELIVWNLQSLRYERQLEASVGHIAGLTASLAFDPSGELLGVGTANGWQMWNVKEKQLVTQGTDVRVYAVGFSPDGRLFAWGDANGVVHLWGIPAK